MPARPLRRGLTAAADLLLPSLCPGCRIAAGPQICPACREALPRLTNGCQRCAAPPEEGGAEDRCRSCGGSGLPGLTRIAAGFIYEGVLGALIRAAKVGDNAAAYRALGELAAVPGGWAPDAGALVAVPRSRRGGRNRHLAAELAAALGTRHRLPVLPLLRSTTGAERQHRLPWSERQRNVRELFIATGAAPERVILVDDILTSGATLSAAAAALRAAGAKRVYGWCLARTPDLGR